MILNTLHPFVGVFLVCGIGAAATPLDLARFARPCCSTDAFRSQTLFDYHHPSGVVHSADGRWIYGLQWAEERDLAEIIVHTPAPLPSHATVEYWFSNWPYDPPHMPTIEDPVDDPWQGRWLQARTAISCDAGRCRIGFLPLEEAENSRARNLPGVTYRRTVKFRLVLPAGPQPRIDRVEVFSQTTLRTVEMRVRVPGTPAFRVYNGRLVRRQGDLLSVEVAEPRPAGSNDITVIQVRNGGQSFAFAPADLERGSIQLPQFHACITLPAQECSAAQDGRRIRQRLAAEPEQTLERATREIPALDPVVRQGGRLYLPLAADSSWQKFAFEWGGDVFISKRATKAMGRELARLTWPGDRIGWHFGKPDEPCPTTMDQLPLPVARCVEGPVEYREEAFATLLTGPLSPDDTGRSEQTPAVLMVRIEARNRSAAAATAEFSLAMDPAESLRLERGLLLAGDAVRARIVPPPGSTPRIAGRAVTIAHPLKPGERATAWFALPFIPQLTEAERRRLLSLQYTSERQRIIAYWQTPDVPFHVPEATFNRFARAVETHIRISATKDPAGGLYMAPAAGYSYKVFANEAAFQAQLLDAIGAHAVARKYLDALVALQGSKPFPGTYTGDQKAVYHGARVNPDYDYTASSYNLDHGTVLWTLALHYSVTRDAEWLRKTAPSMKLAADWIIEQRQLTKAIVDGEHCPEYGLLPGGHLEDNHDWGHWFSVNAFASAGLTALGEALQDIGDAGAGRYGEQARAYCADLRAAVENAAAMAPAARLRDGTYSPYVPTRAHQRFRYFGPVRVGYYSRYPEKVLPTYRLSATREVLYGPMILLDTGIFDAGEPLADWVLDDWEDNATMSTSLGLNVHGWVDEEYWFSRGGMVFQANLQNPVRTYLRRGEARAAIRNLYNDFVSCYYPTVNVFTEEYRQWRSPSGPFYKIPDEAKFVHRLRDSLVLEYDGALRLAAALPERWYAPGETVRVTSAPTIYGPVSYTLRGFPDRVEGEITLPSRNPFREATIRVRRPILSVAVDGRPWTDLDAATGAIRLPQSKRPLRLVVKTR